MKETIYLDHAATTPLDEDALARMLPYLKEVYGNADSPHSTGRKAMRALDEARDCVAELIGAKQNEIYFTSGGTESDNFAIIGGAKAKRSADPTRTRVIISSIEHHAALFAAETLKKDGFTITYLPVNERGVVEVRTLEETIDSNVALVALMAANNETGALQPIQAASELAHEHGAVFFTDAVQYAPHRRIAVKELGVDMLAFSAHKFNGPKGVGALYIKSGVKVEKLVGGGEQERGLRGGTSNVAGIVALAAAYEKTVREMSETEEKMLALRRAFLQAIQGVDGVYINGDETGLPSILNLRIVGVSNTAFLYRMDLQGVCLAAGSACASASVKPSHVLTAMSLTESEAGESVRISFGKENTESEILEAVARMKETIAFLRKS